MASALDPEVRTRRWRRSEYERLIELGMFIGERLELLDGHLVVGEPQHSPHMATVMQAATVLTTAFGEGWHARVQGPLALDDESEPEPDVAVVPGVPLDYFDAHPATAPLVLEVADASLRLDRRFKAGLYARAGLPEYWIVNLVDRVVEVHRDPQPAPDAEYGVAYASIELLRPPATIAPLAMSSVRIAVADLLPRSGTPAR
ncbi:MAG: Uma2 family endonuclease [Candidatus Rokubacteria bacterium]|nr:Uma2 family endonuclease [Candidatus Rokubacteria bacterium]